MEQLKTKDELIAKLRAYTTSPDDDNIRIKDKIKNELLKCPELLYALGNDELECELFNEDGTINEDGEWDRYFGLTGTIRPFIAFPDTQTDMKNYLCYTTSFEESTRYTTTKKNTLFRSMLIEFDVFCYNVNNFDYSVGIPRHDLVSGILRERFNWSNLFGTEVRLIINKEMTTDNNYSLRRLVFKAEMFNGIVNTDSNSRANTINYLARK